MTIHHSLDYLRIEYLPILESYRLKDINSEYGCFIGLDVSFLLYKVLGWKLADKGTKDDVIISKCL